jgi:membrane protease subunit HflK
MDMFSGWRARLAALSNDNPKGPWGGGRGPGSGGNGGGGGGGDDGGGPRNPWAFPPPGGRPRGPKPTALDEFIKRARRGGGGPSFPGVPGGRSMWLIAVAVLLGLWIVFTSVHSIGPQERGVVMYFGRYGGTLEPGLRLTLPAPIASVRSVDVQRIRTEDFPTGGGENLMLTGDQNIIDLAYSVRWDISDPSDYVFQIANPEQTVRATAESAMRSVVASVTLNEAIGAGRTGIESRVAETMQQILNEYNSGVRVQGVAIKQADPPAAVNDDFKAVTAAQQEAQANLNSSRAYAQQIIAHAQGEAASFDKVYEQYRLAPEVTRRRMYYETMEDVLARNNKTIVEAPGVTPYLPLPQAQRRQQPQQQPAPPAVVQQPRAGEAQQ